MTQRSPRGIDRHGLDATFEADETLKSNLILEGRMLSAQQQPDAAADRFAQAAEIEERLRSISLERGLKQKAWVHGFSAASCWAQAGNFHQAIGMGKLLLAESDLPTSLRSRVEEFTHLLQQRRMQWAAGLALTVAATE